MNTSDAEQFSMTIGALCESLGAEASKPMLHGYWLALQDLPIEDVKRAATKALRTCKFMPKPATLRELAGEATPEDAAAIAWVSVQKASRLGSYRGIDFEDRFINAAIRSLGGWPTILDKPQKDFDTWVRKDFITAYVSMARSNASGEVCAPLDGLSETGTHTVIGIDGTEKTVCIGHVKVPSLLPRIGSTPNAIETVRRIPEKRPLAENENEPT